MLSEVNTNFRSVVRGKVAMDFVLKNYNGGKTATAVSRAYNDYIEMKETQKSECDMRKMQKEIEYLHECVNLLMKRAKITKNDILNNNETIVEENNENNDKNLQGNASDNESKKSN